MLKVRPNTTSPLRSRGGFSLLYSGFDRSTNGISVLISFPLPTKIFQFRRCTILTDELRNPWFKACMRLPMAFRSLPRLSSLSKPNHSLNGRFYKNSLVASLPLFASILLNLLKNFLEFFEYSSRWLFYKMLTHFDFTFCKVILR